MECPHCGGVIDTAAKPLVHTAFDDSLHCMVVDGIRRRCTAGEWRLLRVLRERFQRLVPVDFLAQASARDPADGGSTNSVRVQLYYLRRRLDGTPFAIAGSHATGFGLFPAHQVEVTTRRLGRRYHRLRPVLDPQALTEWLADQACEPPAAAGDGGFARAGRARP